MTKSRDKHFISRFAAAKAIEGILQKVFLIR